MTPRARPNHPRRVAWRGNRADRLLLFVILLAIGAGGWLARQQLQVKPQEVRIFHGDTLIARYPYPGAGDPPRTVRVRGDIGTATVLIGPDGVRMTEAPCRSKQCVLSGSHQRSGDMIVCLPNRISVLIAGSTPSSALDALGQ